VLLSLKRRAKVLHESQVFGDLCFEFCDGDATVHVFLQKFVVALFEFNPGSREYWNRKVVEEKEGKQVVNDFPSGSAHEMRNEMTRGKQ